MNRKDGRKLLKRDAVPTLFKHVQPLKKRKAPKARTEQLDPERDALNDHSYCRKIEKVAAKSFNAHCTEAGRCLSIIKILLRM